MRSAWAPVLLLLSVAVHAELLDPQSPPHSLLDELAPMLDPLDIDVARNLNARSVKPGRKPKQARLGMLADVPPGPLASASELDLWESSQQQQLLIAVAAVRQPTAADSEQIFNELWFSAPPEQRVLITLAAADSATAAQLVGLMQAAGYATHDGEGRHYATAGQRLVVDSAAARKSDSEAQELALLGKQVKRKRNSVFPEDGRSSRYYAAGEPDRFRKVDLGDEDTRASIPEIIVSGGIALGERASFSHRPVALVFSPDHSFSLEMPDGTHWAFPAGDPLLQKACFDFALRSLHIPSDAIVDIDERNKVKISQAFRNTDVGYELIGVDEQPFKYISKLSVIKSVIIDTAVAVSADDSTASFDTEYEVRFINPDRRKLAETRAALVYRYLSATDSVSYQDRWGPRAFRLANSNLDGLGTATRKAAIVASWSALFRAVESSDIDFSRGRYEFLKIDKVGKTTPRKAS